MSFFKIIVMTDEQKIELADEMIKLFQSFKSSNGTNAFNFTYSQQKVIMRLDSTYVSELIDSACLFLEVDRSAILGRRRTRRVTECRHMVMDYLFNSKHMTLSDIGKIFDRDHSSIIYAKQHVSDLCTTDKHYSTTYNRLTQFLNAKLP